MSQGQTYPNLSQGWTCLRAGNISGLDLSQRSPGLEVSCEPKVSKSLGPELSIGWTWFVAASVLELKKCICVFLIQKTFNSKSPTGKCIAKIKAKRDTKKKD